MAGGPIYSVEREAYRGYSPHADEHKPDTIVVRVTHVLQHPGRPSPATQRDCLWVEFKAPDKDYDEGQADKRRVPRLHDVLEGLQRTRVEAVRLDRGSLKIGRVKDLDYAATARNGSFAGEGLIDMDVTAEGAGADQAAQRSQAGDKLCDSHVV
ncbi:hypothetical protein S40288_10554 [Stachybotrys chartarum IBT 40288]|nr:hypothetical protein S40288_10554 [Stachybotrys chartarum IBT 40288]